MRTVVAFLAATAVVGMATPAAVGARGHATGHSERLAARARRGDRVARTTLVEEHMGMVRTIALRYRDLGLPVEDLVQEGAIGLLAAVDDFDSSRGTSFSTYAFWRVRAAVTHAVTARGNLVRVPRPVLEHRRHVAAAQRTLTAAGRSPTVRDLAAATALAPQQVAEALEPRDLVSLEGSLPDGTPLADRLADDPAVRPDALVAIASDRRAVRAALQRLRPRKRTIVTRHFGIGREPETLTEIAGDLQLSPERTRALKDEALRDLASDLTGVA